MMPVAISRKSPGVGAIARPAAPPGNQRLRAPLSVGLGQSEHLTPTKAHQRRGFRYFDPVCSQILQHAHPVDLRPAHRNHRHRPKTPQPKPWRVTSSGPTATSLSAVYTACSRNERLGNVRRLTDRRAGRSFHLRPASGAYGCYFSKNFDDTGLNEKSISSDRSNNSPSPSAPAL